MWKQDVIPRENQFIILISVLCFTKLGLEKGEKKKKTVDSFTKALN